MVCYCMAHLVDKCFNELRSCKLSLDPSHRLGLVVETDNVVSEDWVEWLSWLFHLAILVFIHLII